MFIARWLEHNANVGELQRQLKGELQVMRTPVPREVVFAARQASSLSTAHEAVIASNVLVLRSPFGCRAGPGRPHDGQRVPDRSVWRGVGSCGVALVLRQSPKPSIGPALAELRRAAAQEQCARLAARLAALAGPGAKPRGTGPMSVVESVAAPSCVPPVRGPQWVALSEAAAAIVRSLSHSRGRPPSEAS